MAKVRLRRPDAVARNREAVLAAATHVFMEQGYAGATLEAIAEEAGFSKGVMYSQFESKADLFLSLLERRIDEQAKQQRRIVDQQAGTEGLRLLFERFSRSALTDSAWQLATFEFRAVASRDPELKRLYADAHSRTVQHFASAIADLYFKARLKPPFPEQQLAELVLAMSWGLVLEWAANPRAIPREAAFQMLARALGLDESDTNAQPVGRSALKVTAKIGTWRRRR